MALRLNEHFLVGALRRRVLRPPALEGVVADEEGQVPARPARHGLRRIGDALALPLPGRVGMTTLSATASAACADADPAIEVLIGWPEELVIVRRHGVVVAAHGDVVHFGRLALDGAHAIERTGFEHLSRDDLEVRVVLALSIAGIPPREVTLGPGESTSLGPYRIEHDRSFDPTDRPSAVRHHAYGLRVTRSPTAPPITADPQRARPLAHGQPGADPRALVDLARSRQLLTADEALVCEDAAYAALLRRFEGPQHNLDSSARAAGPVPTLRWRGDSLSVTVPRVFRGAAGEACWGRARILLDATGAIAVTRTELGTAPGRLRRAR